MKGCLVAIRRGLNLGLRMQVLPIAAGLLLAKLALFNLLARNETSSKKAIAAGADLVSYPIHWAMFFVGIAIVLRGFYLAKTPSKKR